jgi:RND family efflux transporter MFP subunit
MTPAALPRTVRSHRCLPVLLFVLVGLLPLPLTAAPTDEPVTVPVARVEPREIPALVELSGTVQAAERAAISAKISGVVSRVAVSLGSTVAAGEVLVTLEAGEITARLRQAEAQLAQAKRHLERDRGLLAKNAATPETVRTRADQFAIAQATLQEARSMLAYTTITAPFAGVIIAKQVNAGDLATPGTVLLEMEDNRRLQVRTALPESLIVRVRMGDQLSVLVPAAGVEVAAAVAEIGPAADPGSRSTAITLDLPAGADLRSGQFARVRVPGAAATALLVPESAVVPSGQMDRVFVIEGDTARLRLVRTGLRRDGLVEILAGLDPGETVATGNNRLLENGRRVRVEP